MIILDEKLVMHMLNGATLTDDIEILEIFQINQNLCMWSLMLMLTPLQSTRKFFRLVIMDHYDLEDLGFQVQLQANLSLLLPIILQLLRLPIQMLCWNMPVPPLAEAELHLYIGITQER